MEAEPHARLPSPGVQSLGGGASRAMGFAGQWGLTAGAPPGPAKQTSTLGGRTQVLRAKAKTPQKPEPDLPSGLGGSPWGWGWLWLSGIIKEGGQYSWGPMWTLGGVRHFKSLALGPHPTAYNLQCWDASGQTTNRVGNGPVHQQTGYLDFLTHSCL